MNFNPKQPTLQINLRSLNLREDIFQTRYNSSTTGLTNLSQGPTSEYLHSTIQSQMRKRKPNGGLVQVNLGKELKLGKKHKLRNSAQVGSHSVVDQYAQHQQDQGTGSFFQNANANRKSKNQMMMASKYCNDLSKMVYQGLTPFDA